MICVPAFCAAWPTAKKIADLISECTVMCSSPAKLAIGPPMPKAKVIRPMCSIDEYANMRLTSSGARGRTPRPPPTAGRSPSSAARRSALCSAPSVSTLQRSTAYSATLSSRPESTAETGVGPSACASGSQLCSGTRPDLGAVADEQEHEGERHEVGLELRLHRVEVRPQQRAALRAEHLLGGEVEQDRAEQRLRDADAAEDEVFPRRLEARRACGTR